MGTRTVVLTGKASWAKVFEDNRDMKGFEGRYEEFDGAYTIEVEISQEDYARLQKAGSMKKFKVSEDGVKVKFERKHNSGYEWSSGAPKVLKDDGSDWSFVDDGPIGNGSLVEVTVSVYDTKRPSIKGTRLDKVKVTDPVEYHEKEKMPW